MLYFFNIYELLFSCDHHISPHIFFHIYISMDTFFWIQMSIILFCPDKYPMSTCLHISFNHYGIQFAFYVCFQYEDFDQTRLPTLTKAVFFVFAVLVPILLLNMLIAMMGNTYSQVIARSEKEWKRQVKWKFTLHPPLLTFRSFRSGIHGKVGQARFLSIPFMAFTHPPTQLIEQNEQE